LLFSAEIISDALSNLKKIIEATIRKINTSTPPGTPPDKKLENSSIAASV
jgi:hypothetical protein